MDFILFFGFVILILIFSKNKWIYQLIVFACALFIANRGMDVPDTLAYFFWYNNPPLANPHVEQGFAYLCYFFRQLGVDFRVFLFCIALLEIEIWTFCCNKLFTKEKLSILLALCLSFYGIYFWGCVLRASLAITIGFVGFTSLLKTKSRFKSIILFYAFVLLATTMHKTALIYLFCPLFVFSIGKKFRWISLLVSIVLSIVVAKSGAANYFQILIDASSDLEKYQGYLQKENNDAGISLSWLLSLAICIYVCLYYNRIICSENTIICQYFLNLYMFGFMILTIANTIPAGSRLGMMLTFYEFIIVYYIAQQIKAIPKQITCLFYAGCRFSYMIHSFPLFLNY